MLIERRGNNEILIKFSDLSSFDFQRLIDYVRFLEIRAKSKAKQKDIDILASSTSVNWWKKNKKRFTQ